MHCNSTIHAFKNIKNGSYSTIHIFKNYFITIFSVFSFSNNKLNPNGSILVYEFQKNIVLFFFLVRNKTMIHIEQQKLLTREILYLISRIGKNLLYYVSESKSLGKWGSMINSLCTVLDGNLRAWKYRLELIFQPPGLGSVTSVAGLVVVSYDTYLFHLGAV